MVRAKAPSIILCAVLALAMAVSGCVGDGASKDKTSSAPATSPSPSNSTSDHVVAVLAVLADGRSHTAASGSVSVTAGNVTFDASGSRGPAGAALSFAWTVDGQAKPGAEKTLTVPLAAGNHTANVTVTSGSTSDSAGVRLLARPGLLPVAGNDVAISTTFGGTFAQKNTAAVDSPAAHQLHPFDVPAGAVQITAWLTWFEASAADNAGSVGDLDLHLKDPANTDAAESISSTDYEYIRLTTALTPGRWTADVRPYLTVQNTYTLSIVVWMKAPTVKVFTKTVGVADGVLADDAAGFLPHKVDVPADVGIVAARLAWTDPSGESDCTNSDVEMPDLDLYAYVGTSKKFSSTYGMSCEFGFLDAEAGKTLGPAAGWEFRVAPFLVAQADYILTVEYA